MLEKPGIHNDKIVACLQDEYSLSIARLDFLPLGADTNTAVYRAISTDGEPYFVKLRRGDFNPVAVTLPAYLHEQGLQQIIPPLPGREGQLWADLEPFEVILYSFIEGRDGFEVKLTADQWRDFGAAVRFYHTVALPPGLASLIPHETYSPHWRQSVRDFLSRIQTEVYTDPVAVELAAFLKTKRDTILDLVTRAEELALLLQAHPPENVLCHSDLHAGNIFVDAHQALFIVDWDEPIFAPKERDLMFIGGGQGFTGCTPQEEEPLFYRGYGHAQVDAAALVYYRCERILVDIAVYCQEIFLTTEGGADREQALQNVMSNFQSQGTIDMAYRADRLLRES